MRDTMPDLQRLAGAPGAPEGQFFFKYKGSGEVVLLVLFSSGLGWEHASVSVKRLTKKKRLVELNRCPTWEEMCKIKEEFWKDEETVVQFHPPRSQYVSTHPYVLHLWRKVDFEQPLPDPIMVGFPGDNRQSLKDV